MTIELKSLGTTLDETLNKWKQYNSLVDELQNWFSKAEQLASIPDRRTEVSSFQILFSYLFSSYFVILSSPIIDWAAVVAIFIMSITWESRDCN